jgi:RNA polymerase sigma-70 factor (ECF subfamily)
MTDLTAAERSSGTITLDDVEGQLERHRGELTGYAYRMLGSPFEAEDAVQETLVRAWRAFDGFEGRSAVRAWLYRIATNVCLDMLKSRKRRAMPMDLGPAQHTAEVVLGAPLPETTWIQPMPDARVNSTSADPAETAILRESIQLAFVTLLQQLPPRQRAVLILREVLQWRAAEVAELLETSVASVNSALQRARSTLTATQSTDAEEAGQVSQAGQLQVQPGGSDEAVDQALLARYLSAFERYDVDALVLLLHEDATMSMPPYDLWLQGVVEFRSWLLGPGIHCEGSRLIPTTANGCPAFGQYRVSATGEGHEPWSLQVLQIEKGKITGITYFLDTQPLFPLFGLPPRL